MAPVGDADTVDPRIAAVLAWCAAQGDGDLTLAIPFALPAAAVHALLMRPGVLSVVLTPPLAAGLAAERVGEFLPLDFSWRLPPRTARRVVYVGGRDCITARMIGSALRRGVGHLVYWDLDRWGSRPLAFMATAKLRSKLVARIGASLPGSANLFEGIARHRFTRLLGVPRHPFPSPSATVPNRVIMACPTLVAGGAERQILNTVLGLRGRGVTDIRIIVSHLFSPPGNDFFYDKLVDAGADVAEIQGPMSTAEAWERYDSQPVARLMQQLRPLFQRLPPEIGQEVANLYIAFRELRPAVVHAWLDHSCVCAGLAALMAGVPRVLLSGRNVSPIHFPYIMQPYMRPAYRAMATRAEAVYLNNSHGGAADYAAWLGLDATRFTVIYNGIDSAGVTAAGPGDIAELRRRHGIPAGAQLVGGMFRLSAEKRPALWVDTLMQLTTQRDDIYGLLFGAGPLQSDLEAKLARAGLADRVRLAPPTKESMAALSAFDLLLLTSRWEGTPNVVIEAQAVGTPVVVCGGGGAREALRHGVSGLFVEQPNADALAAALLSLLDNDTLRRRLADAGPAFVTERFSLDRMISETLRTYGGGPGRVATGPASG
ncbi:glycosyltransferase [uncultured Thiodictyon sp.]|uniref:glycosyltransferase n=1 Tax=uncultured Thiodictyon sp. TaxID=1846217 RepID=UPI0025E79344|nr:glycosyltransferase [uncultured Thiodictyon sp.]